jgi:hypothetical protein
MKRHLTTISALAIGITALVLSLETEPAVPGLGAFEAKSEAMRVGVSEVFAQGFHECLAEGCSSDQCAAATQNGFTCKRWRCFEGCMDGKGFDKPCIEYGDRKQKCEAANHACVRQCKSR